MTLIFVGYFQYRTSHVMIIWIFTILLRYRRQGIARSLLTEVENIAKSEISDLYLTTCCAQLPAVRFYKNFGFDNRKATVKN